MSIAVTPAMQVKFQNNLELQLQQTKSKLESMPGAVIFGDEKGAEKIKIKDIVGNVAPQFATERHGDTKYGNRSFDGIWIAKPDEGYDADLVDNADNLGTSLELGSATMMSITATVNRVKDQRVLEGFYGSVISGKTGTTTTAFPGGQTIAVTVGGAAGAQKMNTAKIRAATKLLAQGYADLDADRFMVLTADDNDALLTEIPVTSADFKESYKGQVDERGRVVSLLGWKFMYLELDNPMLGTIPALATDGSGYRKNPFWVAGGLVANYWQRVRTMLDRLPQKLGSVQYFAGTTLASTRTQAGMSGIILNAKG